MLYDWLFFYIHGDNTMNVPSIKLTREERDELSKTALRQTAATRDTLRAGTTLLAADGLKYHEIAKTLRTSGNTVGK